MGGRLGGGAFVIVVVVVGSSSDSEIRSSGDDTLSFSLSQRSLYAPNPKDLLSRPTTFHNLRQCRHLRILFYCCCCSLPLQPPHLSIPPPGQPCIHFSRDLPASEGIRDNPLIA